MPARVLRLYFYTVIFNHGSELKTINARKGIKTYLLLNFHG